MTSRGLDKFTAEVINLRPQLRPIPTPVVGGKGAYLLEVAYCFEEVLKYVLHFAVFIFCQFHFFHIRFL